MKKTKIMATFFVFALVYAFHARPASAANSLDAADGNPTDAVYVDNDGNVGIGTVNPSRKLEVEGNNPRVLVDAESGNPELNLRASGKTPWAMYQDSITGDLNFYQAGNKITFDDGTGSVGIGTTNPQGKLDVNGPIYSRGTFNNAAIRLRNTEAMETWCITSYVHGGLRFWNETSEKNRVIIRQDGNVVIGEDAGYATEKLSVNGNVRIAVPPVWDEDDDYDLTWDTSTGVISREGSSRRYKQNIHPFQEDFHKILRLEAKQYEMREGYGKPGQQLFGYIAEDLDEVGLTKLVTHDAEGRPDGIKYKRIAIYLNEVLKEHERDIAELKSEFSKFESLKKENADLHARIRTLESLVGRLTSERSVLRDGLPRWTND